MERLSESSGRSSSGPETGVARAVASMPDDAVVLLTESRRRHTLGYLDRFSYPVSLHTLATHVAAAEREIPVETVSDRRRERVAIALHHVDLPKLVAADLVDYDPESRLVVRTAAGERAAAVAGLTSTTHEG